MNSLVPYSVGMPRLDNNLDFDSDYDSSGEESTLLGSLQKRESADQPKLKYPKSIFFIIGNEFCERFTYYGLRTVLVLYFSEKLMYDNDMSAALFHTFAMLAYLTPVLGAIIADSFLGKFKTILYLSILYTIGCGVLSGGSFPSSLNLMRILSLVGLVIIAFGTGGIKPCVSAFGGDQFQEGQEKQKQQFFSLFYLSINLGSVFSTILSPIFRVDVKCFGENTCFPLAFGVPSALMLIAITFFIAGKSSYKIKPPEGNIMLKVSKCIGHAIKRKCASQEKKKSHWLDYADDKYDKQLIEDVKVFLRVLVLYIPLPVFWALFDQTGSRWTQQASNLDGDFFGLFYIKADQMQSINAILIVVFIPLFEYIIYPIFNKLRLLRKPLQRITTGGILAGVAFVCTGLLQLQIESNQPSLSSPGHSEIIIINNSPCQITFQGLKNAEYVEKILPFGNAIFEEMPNDVYSWQFKPENCSITTPYDYTFKANSTIASIMITVESQNLKVLERLENKEKSATGEAMVRIFHNIEIIDVENASIKLVGKKDNKEIKIEKGLGVTNYTLISPGTYDIYIPQDSKNYHPTPISIFHAHSGGKYIISIYNTSDSKEPKSSTYTLLTGNNISILYQIIPYAIITAGEILLSITGLEFSYSQAPTSMKSVIQATWLLMVAFGNLIDVIISKSKVFPVLSHELFFFAGLMFVVMIIFAVLAYFYKYVNEEQYEEERKTSIQPNSADNLGYVEETDFNK